MMTNVMPSAFKPIDFKNFKTELQPKERFDLIPYASNFIAKNPHAKIYVGSDSQNKQETRRRRSAKVTKFVTVVAFRLGHNGVHVIYLESVYKPMIRDVWTRLWGELERTRELVEYLETNSSLKVHQVDLDYNEDEEEYSHRLLAAGKGLFTGLGYRVGTKPGELVATKAADHLARL